MMNITIAILFFIFIVIVIHFTCLRNTFFQKGRNRSCKGEATQKPKDPLQDENNPFPCSREELFQIILDNISVAILVKDVEKNFKYLLWNKKLEQQTGIPEESILGKTCNEIEPWIGINDFITQLDQEAIRKGSIQQEAPCQTVSGKEIFYKTDKRCIHFPNGRSIILDMCLDLTTEWELKKKLADIVEKQDRLIAKTDLLYDCLDYLSSTTDRKSVYQYILRRFGEGEEALRSYIYIFDSPDPIRVDHAYEWVSESAKPIPDVLKSIDLIHLQNTKKQLLKCKTASMISTELLDTESIFSSWVQEEKIGAFICVPLFYQGILYGILGIDYRDRQKVYPEISLPVISSAARLIELVHAHEQMEIEKKTI